jgi:zinc protease
MKDLFNFKYEKFKLDNGLNVILYPNNNLPLAAVNIWYKTGSANEKKGKTGFAHLFEHMMFQGSQNVPKEKHFRYIQEAGGTLNGSTSIDRTNYFETVPSNYLEMALWLESDRMGFLLPALTQEKLDNQKDVVMNERRQRYENQPYGLAWEKLFSNLFPEEHPYHWPTIGWMEDIEKFELNDVINFFKIYYTPNNASLVIGGNFKVEEAKILVDKYFGDIPGNVVKPEIEYCHTPLKETKKIIVPDNIQLPRIYLAWHSDPVFGEDDAAMDMLSEILTSSKNSRLYKQLVFDKQIAQDISSFQYSAKLDGAFIITSTAKPGVSLDEIKKNILGIIEDININGITPHELQRAKNGIKSTFIYSLQNLDKLVNQINYYNTYLDNPNYFEQDLARYENITVKDIQRTAEKYLSSNFVELHYIPKD